MAPISSASLPQSKTLALSSPTLEGSERDPAANRLTSCRFVGLSVKGKAVLVVQDTEAYQTILDHIDRMEAVVGN